MLKTYKENLPLLSAFNSDFDGLICWCTPSIHPLVPKVRDIYQNDMSVSYHSFGNPSMNTGVFLKAHKLASKAYGSDNTLFTVNGSTGSNFIVLRALKHQLGKVNVLAQRNIHKSIVAAVEDFKININFINPHYDNDLQIFVPNSIEEILISLKQNPETNVLLLTSPTYEGYVIDLKKLVEKVNKYDSKIIIFVDEAWGAHFHFSSELPISSMDAGVDICVQSTHKMGSALQQTSMIHWKNRIIKNEYVLESYRSLMTTSPSFHLLASLDAARYFMEKHGKEVIHNAIEVADAFAKDLMFIKGVKVIHLNEVKKKYPQILDMDKTKLLVNVSETNLNGCDIAEHLEKEFGIVVEKYEAENITFIVTFKNTLYDVKQTVEAFQKTIINLNKKNNKKEFLFPKFPTNINKIKNSFEVENKIKSIKLDKAIGLTSAENVVPYPPGIAMIIKGEKISKEHVEYLKALKKTKGLVTVVMSDIMVESILIEG